MKSSDPAYRLTAAVMATADAFLRESQRLFRPFGLTGAQYNVLNILALHPDGISQRELGDALVVDRSNVTGLLDRMAKADWIKRDDDPADRRIYRVSLTKSGRKLWLTVHPLYLEVVAQITHGLTGPQVQNSLQVLAQLQARAASWSLPAKSFPR
jgi:DNA-binding MarR family transcriptional regulator